MSKNVTTAVVVLVILVGVNIGTAAISGDAIFYNDGVVTSDERYESVTVYDSPPETTTIDFYGQAKYLTMHDSSTLNLHEGGKFESFSNAWNRLYDSSTLNVFEGAKIGAGSAANMDLYDSSTLNVYGGIVDIILGASDSTTINLYEGSLGMLGGLADNSTLNVYGGYVGVFLSNITLSPTATVNIYGYGFEYTPHGRWMPPISDSDQGWWVSKLTGYDFDGGPITFLGIPDPDTHDNINLIPEPTTFLLLGLGGLALLWKIPLRDSAA